MTAPERNIALEDQIEQWRSFLRRRQAIQSVDIAELEDHLREQIDGLTEAGLATDEAFLVAVKRMGDLDALSREFAREHSERLWKQLVVPPADGNDSSSRMRKEGIIAFTLAVAAGMLVKLPALFGIPMTDGNEAFYMRNAPFFVLPLLAGYFTWKRGLHANTTRLLVATFIVAAAIVNFQPLPTNPESSSVFLLSAMHLPMALWIAVGVAYAGGRWNQIEGRMDFIRFSGELFIYYVLIAAGGGVTSGLTMAIFKAIGVDLEPFFQSWVIPCGAAGGVLVASWLVEAKQSVIENMVPVLTRIFTPVLAIALVSFLIALVVTGRGIAIDRDVLIIFDLLLALVVALLLYSVSARDPRTPPGPFDYVQLVLVISALIADVVALWAIGSRISEFGFTPNRVAALGENIILLANLVGAAVLSTRFLRGRGSFVAVEKWQTDYLPVYAAWATIVVVVFPLVF
jgi:hypothetical protein